MKSSSPELFYDGVPRSHRARGHEGLRIYLAEDDDDLRTLLVESLEACGHEVAWARNGDEMLSYLHGVALIPAARPDVVIMDVRMPTFSGLELLEAMRDADWDIPVVLVTGFGDADLHHEAERLGAVAVLDKPFSYDALSTVLANLDELSLLATRRALERRAASH